MDLRILRTEFFEKKRAYACSFDSAMRIVAEPRSASEVRVRSTSVFGSVFHVFGDRRVPGLDGRGYDCPLGALTTLDETTTFQIDGSVGSIEGRMVITTADAVVINAIYDGTLHVPGHLVVLASGGAEVVGKTFLALHFETSHPKYHWLTEHAAVAFGTWTLHPEIEAERKAGEPRRALARYDVYNAD
jgi:hypothetical protein